MKFVYIVSLLFLISCIQEGTNSDPMQLVKDYYEFRNEGEYASSLSLLANDIKVVDGDYTLASSKEELKTIFLWKNNFNPITTITEIRKERGEVHILTSTSSSRLEFLGNSPLKLREVFHISKGKIARIEIVEYQDIDWDIWNAKRDTLIKWIDINHPEFSGCVNDISNQGGANFLKAIRLYNAYEPDL